MAEITDTIAKISNIEDRATLLIQSANEEKASLQKEHEEKIRQFDALLQKQTNETIQRISSDLHDQIKSDLDAQRAKTNELLDGMQKEYDEKHTFLAELIVKSIIGA